ncbi:MAG: hypothetical protein NXH70_00360 [Hyphomonas sp.]|nr:hypothetical protein [Hyphomonas sp.]
MGLDEFIERWSRSSASERSNYQLFLSQLAAQIGAPEPDPATEDDARNAYVFDRAVKDPVSGTTRFVDLYKRGCFVCEAKQGSEKKSRPADARQHELRTGEAIPEKTKKGTAVRGTPGWAKAMVAAKQQAHNYARALDPSEGAPPFLVVVDVGHVIELYSDFSGTARNYTQFQDGTRFRIALDDLRDERVRETLRLVWTDPHALDPAKKAAKVTRTIADQLAALGNSFEGQGHDSEKVARFLMRCLFSMFAEDVELIPKDSFTNLLIELRDNTKVVQPTLEALWTTMNEGGFSPVLRHDLLRFNGGLFAEANALPVNELQLGLLIAAAEADWRDVEPAIFGTLLERALSAKERHKLGAHYTPRAYVERLVMPTIIEPLRADWDAVKAAAFALADKDDEKSARDEVRKFHRQICEIRVLDPACGSGNFLYVSMEQMKRLEGEVLDVLTELGETQARLSLAGETVDPHQFLGIEINPWAAAVAELVLWIGYLQWHFKTFGEATPDQPVLKDFHNIECRDALLILEGEHPRIGDDGQPVTRWDGETMKRHPVTGEMVPDAAARVTVMNYESAKPAHWPAADFIVGNPPFIGASRMREALGDGYVETLWATYPKMPQSADFVMFWWENAAKLAKLYDADARKGLRRFGFITTNSLRQTFNRRVLQPHVDDRKRPISLLFAIPDHPWVDSLDGAAVRIAMTVAGAGRRDGRLLTLASEAKTGPEVDGREVTFSEQFGRIFANLQAGADVAGAESLSANQKIAGMGVKLHGVGFLIGAAQAFNFADQNKEAQRAHFPLLINGRDLVQESRGMHVIDFFGLSDDEARQKFPLAYQHILETVKPERDQNRRKVRRERWWLFGETISTFRPAFKGLSRYIATARTARHRIFSFVDQGVLPESKVVAIASSEAWHLGILSSKFHLAWALPAGGWLGVGNDATYNHAECFYCFPFPVCTSEQKERLRDLGERLDAHRKARQAEHPKLTLTQMYNVLERLREIEASSSGEVLEGREREIYDQGQIGLLKDLHDQIDAATAEAYGWPANLSDEEILERLVALNRERHLEEIGGNVRWLRPEYQNPSGEAAAARTGELSVDQGQIAIGKHPWPKDLPQQMAMVRSILVDLGTASVEEVRGQFKRGQTKTIRERLDTLTALGQAERVDEDRYAA